MFDDPAKRQYLILSAIISVILSAILSFAFADLLEGPLVSGFPISITDLSGIGKFLAQVINTVVLGALLTIPIYYGIDSLRNRGRY